MMSRKERAKQFMPFASLKGYDLILKEQELVAEKKREITEEQAIILSNALLSLKKGDVVRVLYYQQFGYIEKIGAVSEIDIVNRRIRVVKTYISFDDLWEISLLPQENT